MQVKFTEDCRAIHANLNFEKMPKTNEQGITSEIIFTKTKGKQEVCINKD